MLWCELAPLRSNLISDLFYSPKAFISVDHWLHITVRNWHTLPRWMHLAAPFPGFSLQQLKSLCHRPPWSFCVSWLIYGIIVWKVHLVKEAHFSEYKHSPDILSHSKQSDLFKHILFKTWALNKIYQHHLIRSRRMNPADFGNIWPFFLHCLQSKPLCCTWEI